MINYQVASISEVIMNDFSSIVIYSFKKPAYLNHTILYLYNLFSDFFF